MEANNFVLQHSISREQNITAHRSHYSSRAHHSHASSSYSSGVSTYSLTINTVPSDAKVQIIDTKLVYYDGIKVKKGQYFIRVSKSGHKTCNFCVDFIEDSVYSIVLDKK